MVKRRIILLILFLTLPLCAGSERQARMSVVANLVKALNYNKYEQFIRDGSPDWRKRMNRSNYNKLHTRMITYIGHIVSWKPLSKRSNGKIDTYTFRLTGDSENIALVMQVQMYRYKNRPVVHNVSFVKR